MGKIFIFTAGNPDARAHLQDSIINPIDENKVFHDFPDTEHDKLRNILSEGKGFYAWGAVPGPQNLKRWESLSKGDFVFCVYDNSYHYVAQVLMKYENENLARAVWGEDENGNTWQYIYFLTKPTAVNLSVVDLIGFLNSGYMGFTKISDEKIANIIDKFGSVESFIDQKVLGGKPMYEPSPLENIIASISNTGFVFEPWQIAAYITALRTKPFVILAGVTGTGKSKLPDLVSKATSGVSKLISVRPDWTDSSDVLGYCSLNEKFRPGQLLVFVQEATESPDKHHVCIIDEMNIARVEHYFAEILSKIEDRRKASNGGFESSRLLGQELSGDDAHWSTYGLPANLAIVGTVNMDESSHGFSRKVLDRAFTIELSDIDLTKWESVISEEMTPTPWPVDKWHPRAIQLSQLALLTESERKEIDRVIKVLTEINSFLVHAQLQVGYRSRDEIALFIMHAQDYKASFVTSSGVEVDPLDLALLMKVLPRIVGGSSPVRRAILQLLGWAVTGKGFQTDEDAKPTIDLWESGGRSGAVSEALYPRTAARLCLMWDRLLSEGFTSFWL